VNGEYNERVGEQMKSKLQLQLFELEKLNQKWEDFVHGPTTEKTNLDLFLWTQETLQQIQPGNTIRCFFVHKNAKSGINQFIVNFFIQIRAVFSAAFPLLLLAAQYSRPYLQDLLWIVIALIYIIGMKYLDEIGAYYILVNPHDSLARNSFSFEVNAIKNCSFAPVGRPVLVYYSFKFLSAYGMMAYGVTIGLVVRAISEQQRNVYDFLSMDDVVDQTSDNHASAMQLIFRSRVQLPSNICHAVHMDMLFRKMTEEMMPKDVDLKRVNLVRLEGKKADKKDEEA
jgi:hypothetical protein